jgi:hypothetical protein
MSAKKHPDAERIGGPGASHENRKQPEKSKTHGDREERIQSDNASERERGKRTGDPNIDQQGNRANVRQNTTGQSSLGVKHLPARLQSLLRRKKFESLRFLMPEALFGLTLRSLEFQTCPINAAPRNSFPEWRKLRSLFSSSFLIAATLTEAAEPRGCGDGLARALVRVCFDAKRFIICPRPATSYARPGWRAAHAPCHCRSP